MPDCKFNLAGADDSFARAGKKYKRAAISIKQAYFSRFFAVTTAGEGAKFDLKSSVAIFPGQVNGLKIRTH